MKAAHEVTNMKNRCIRMILPMLIMIYESLDGHSWLFRDTLATCGEAAAPSTNIEADFRLRLPGVRRRSVKVPDPRGNSNPEV
jgi:hypothetical protein